MTTMTIEKQKIAMRVANILFEVHGHQLDGSTGAGDIYGVFNSSDLTNFDPQRGYSWNSFCTMRMNDIVKNMKRKLANGASALKAITSDETLTNFQKVEVFSVQNDGDYSEEGAYAKNSRSVPCHYDNHCFDDPPIPEGVREITPKDDNYKPVRRWLSEGNKQRAAMAMKKFAKEELGLSDEAMEGMDFVMLAHNKICQERYRKFVRDN